jgi:phosphatidylglycerophosphate synthase
MFDARLRPLIDPPLNRAGARLAGWGVTANQLSGLGILAGLGAAAAILLGHFPAAIALVLVSRLLDGLDGAVATRKTPFGGYLDIVGDFLFYVAVPLAFGLSDPANLKPAMVLLASFALTGVSFLAFAAVSAEQGLETTAHGEKSFFYSTGLAEGGETILAFVLMLLFPTHFPLIAWAFAALCGLTVVQRSLLAWRMFNSGP